MDVMDAVYSGHSGIVVYGGGHIVFWCKKVKPVNAMDAVCSGCSMQWTQWNSDIWWWGHCSLVQKGQTSGFSGHSHTVDTVHSGHSTQWTQWMQYAVDAVCSGIVVYGGGHIVFGAKRSNQWMQWMQYAVYSTQWMQRNSDIWWWGHSL